jgi:hypothetical protein
MDMVECPQDQKQAICSTAYRLYIAVNSRAYPVPNNFSCGTGYVADDCIGVAMLYPCGQKSRPARKRGTGIQRFVTSQSNDSGRKVTMLSNCVKPLGFQVRLGQRFHCPSSDFHSHVLKGRLYFVVWLLGCSGYRLCTQSPSSRKSLIINFMQPPIFCGGFISPRSVPSEHRLHGRNHASVQYKSLVSCENLLDGHISLSFTRNIPSFAVLGALRSKGVAAGGSRYNQRPSQALMQIDFFFLNIQPVGCVIVKFKHNKSA